MSLYRIFCSLHLIQLAVIVVGAPGRYISGEHLMPATKATVVALLLGLATSAALSASPTSDQAVFRDTYQQLVEINTTFSEGSCTRAAQAMAVRLRDAGMPERDIHVIVPAAEWVASVCPQAQLAFGEPGGAACIHDGNKALSVPLF